MILNAIIVPGSNHESFCRKTTAVEVKHGLPDTVVLLP